MLGQLIAGFVIVLVGTALLPSVANQVTASYANASGGGAGANVTGASSSIVQLCTLFYALAIVLAAVSIAVSGLRSVGM